MVIYHVHLWTNSNTFLSTLVVGCTIQILNTSKLALRPASSFMRGGDSSSHRVVVANEWLLPADHLPESVSE